MVWRNNTGKFRSMNDPQRIVSVGQVGSADIIGVQPVTITPEMVGKVIGRHSNRSKNTQRPPVRRTKKTGKKPLSNMEVFIF